MPMRSQATRHLNASSVYRLAPSNRGHGRVPVSARGCAYSAHSLSTAASDPASSVDHRSLAQAHGLFITSPYSPGSPLLLPNGAHIFHKLQEFLRAQYPLFGFHEVVTPNIYKKSLWEVSGHWSSYGQDMFSVQGRGPTETTGEATTGWEGEFGLKPMNCPGHCLLFASKVRSHRDLPLRFADFSSLHRNEASGALSGLTRVRRFHQDDAHIFCRPGQILREIERTLDFVSMTYETFQLGPFKLLLSTRPDSGSIGVAKQWHRAEDQLRVALERSGREWSVSAGNGAFYGPKVDIILQDSLGKEHQTATIQLDFQLPERFQLQYQASPGEAEDEKLSADDTLDHGCLRPVILHRAIYGSIERFMALLIEHYAGTYPLWLSPRPATILCLNQNAEVLSHAWQLQCQLSGLPCQRSTSGVKPAPLDSVFLNVDLDTSAKSLGKKIHDAKSAGFNHIIVVGPEEAEKGTMKLKVANQPERTKSKTEEILRAVTGGREYSRSGIEMNAEEGRKYMKALVQNYL